MRPDSSWICIARAPGFAACPQPGQCVMQVRCFVHRASLRILRPATTEYVSRHHSRGALPCNQHGEPTSFNLVTTSRQRRPSRTGFPAGAL